jgi:tol-pal system protein YbgF
MKKTFALFGCVALTACVTIPPEEDPVYLKLTDLEARLVRIERVIENQSLIELSNQVEQLQSQTQGLRGEIETLRFESENAATRQRELYLDVDKRLGDLESSSQTRSAGGLAASATGDSVLGAGGVPSGQMPVPGGNDRANYQAAFEMLKEGRYGESAQAFQQFLVAFDSSPLADNAQYWLAETYYVQRNFQTALPAFEQVLEAYPESRKIPDALLKIGYCNYELKQWDRARAALRQVAADYPETTAARLANQRLERMTQEVG